MLSLLKQECEVLRAKASLCPSVSPWQTLVKYQTSILILQAPRRVRLFRSAKVYWYLVRTAFCRTVTFTVFQRGALSPIALFRLE